MGCDIHIHVEIKSNNEWHHFEGNHFTISDWEKEYTGNDKGNAPFDWRGYNMFGFLAGVRRDFTPIKEPTYEIPKDASKDIKQKWEDWKEDGHSCSYLTARELFEFDYNKDIDTLTNKRRILFEKIHKNVFHMEPETYYDILDGPDSMFFTHLKELTELGNLDDVRIVFWFDN